MEGKINVKYIILCDNDVNIELKLSDIVNNEKISKAIKSEFGKGLRNININFREDCNLSIDTDKEIYEFVVNKDDFADLLVLAEENAKDRKLFKKDCQGIELIDFITID